MARPSEYNFKLCEEICDEVREGGNIKAILKKKRKYPVFSTWCKWKRENMELLNLYITAIQDKSESILERIYEIEEQVESGKLDEKKGRLLIYTAQWKAGKFYPKMFGTNAAIDITSLGKEITQQVSVFQIPDNDRGEVAQKEDPNLEEKK